MCALVAENLNLWMGQLRNRIIIWVHLLTPAKTIILAVFTTLDTRVAAFSADMSNMSGHPISALATATVLRRHPLPLFQLRNKGKI